MWVDSLVNYKPALAGVINRGEVSLVVLDLLCQLFVIKLNVISGSQRWCVWKRDYLDIVLAAKFIKDLAPVMQFMLT